RLFVDANFVFCPSAVPFTLSHVCSFLFLLQAFKRRNLYSMFSAPLHKARFAHICKSICLSASFGPCRNAYHLIFLFPFVAFHAFTHQLRKNFLAPFPYKKLLWELPLHSIFSNNLDKAVFHKARRLFLFCHGNDLPDP